MWPVSYNSTSSLLSMIRTFGSARCAATHSVLTRASGWAYSVKGIVGETTQRRLPCNKTLFVRRDWCLYPCRAALSNQALRSPEQSKAVDGGTDRLFQGGMASGPSII